MKSLAIADLRLSIGFVESEDANLQSQIGNRDVQPASRRERYRSADVRSDFGGTDRSGSGSLFRASPPRCKSRCEGGVAA
jgi:hypothetical protein